MKTKIIEKGLIVLSSYGKQNNQEEVGIIHEIRRSPGQTSNEDLLDYKIKYLISGMITTWITNDGKSGDGSVKSMSVEDSIRILEEYEKKTEKEIKQLKNRKSTIRKYIKEIYIGIVS